MNFASTKWKRKSKSFRRSPRDGSTVAVALRQTVCEKMATVQQKTFSVLQFLRCESVVTKQREFRRRYGIDPPGAQSILQWYRQFDRTCLRIMCKESERISNVARGSQTTAPIENWKFIRRQFGMFWDDAWLWSCMAFWMTLCVCVGRDSSLGIATSYGLDCTGIESRWGRGSPHLSRPALGST